MVMRVSGWADDSIVDGPGIRFTLFTQGCPHRCPGCHNPQTHDFGGGREVDTGEIIAIMSKNPLLDGLTLSGGEPFEQPEPCAELARAAREMGLNVWAFSGYTFEEIMADDKKAGLLRCVDVLVDGRFILEQRTLEKKFAGSRNQRLIDVKRTLEAGEIVQID